MHIKLLLAACTSCRRKPTPNIRSHWSQTANQRHLTTGKRRQNIPLFQLWHTALQLELLVITYMSRYFEQQISPYMWTALQSLHCGSSAYHINYARWVPVHIRDMVNLRPTGNFIICKMRWVFSSMAIDQAHEQNNAAVKSDGGVGLT